jgi:hypothetical protein
MSSVQDEHGLKGNGNDLHETEKLETTGTEERKGAHTLTWLFASSVPLAFPDAGYSGGEWFEPAAT